MVGGGIILKSGEKRVKCDWNESSKIRKDWGVRHEVIINVGKQHTIKEILLFNNTKKVIQLLK